MAERPDTGEGPALLPEIELHDFLLRSLKGVCGAYERYLHRTYGMRLTTWQHQIDRASALTALMGQADGRRTGEAAPPSR